jgi:hypothetical protein
MEEEEYDPEKHGYVKNKRRPGYSLPNDPVNTSGENDPTETTQAGGPVTFQKGFGDRGGAAGGGEWTPGRGPGAPGTDMGFGNDGGGGVEGGATITASERAEIKKRALARYGHS